ncbi:sugar transferase [Sphingobacterium faecium]|uniref:sugar transferase n=1 Tax=Sphingobacterium faecium TaxID=34087 RepID=UPI00320AEF3A
MKHPYANAYDYVLPVYKRFFDLVMAIVLLIITWPIWMLIAILIGVETKGQVIYHTKRVGAGRKVFTLYKFRTMCIGADRMVGDMAHLNVYHQDDLADKALIFNKFEPDFRVTKIGNFLRLSHLDELPQLFNVIKGEMSIVGNRPLECYEAEQLINRNETLRFDAPSGMTGLWQVQQYRKKRLLEQERIALDNRYAVEQSFALDMLILIKTIPIVLIWPKFTHNDQREVNN